MTIVAPSPAAMELRSASTPDSTGSGSEVAKPCGHSRHFDLFRIQDGCWVLSEQEDDFGAAFADFDAAIGFAQTFCRGEDAMVRIRSGKSGGSVTLPLNAIVALSPEELNALIAAPEAQA